MQKTAKALLIVCLFVFVLAGCEKQAVFSEPDMMPKLIDKTEELTEKAVVDKDINLARDLWGQVSEYGIAARENDKEELAVSLDKLACTYAYLVDYLMTDDQEQLDYFKIVFNEAINDLRIVSSCTLAENKKV